MPTINKLSPSPSVSVTNHSTPSKQQQQQQQQQGGGGNLLTPSSSIRVNNNNKASSLTPSATPAGNNTSSASPISPLSPSSLQLQQQSSSGTYNNNNNQNNNNGSTSQSASVSIQNPQQQSQQQQSLREQDSYFVKCCTEFDISVHIDWNELFQRAWQNFVNFRTIEPHKVQDEVSEIVQRFEAYAKRSAVALIHCLLGVPTMTDDEMQEASLWQRVRGSAYFFRWGNLFMRVWSNERAGHAQHQAFRAIMSVRQDGVHVPLSTLIKYRGILVSVQALVPLHPNSTPLCRVDEHNHQHQHSSSKNNSQNNNNNYMTSASASLTSPVVTMVAGSGVPTQTSSGVSGVLVEDVVARPQMRRLFESMNVLWKDGQPLPPGIDVRAGTDGRLYIVNAEGFLPVLEPENTIGAVSAARRMRFEALMMVDAALPHFADRRHFTELSTAQFVKDVTAHLHALKPSLYQNDPDARLQAQLKRQDAVMDQLKKLGMKVSSLGKLLVSAAQEEAWNTDQRRVATEVFCVEILARAAKNLFSSVLTAMRLQAQAHSVDDCTVAFTEALNTLISKSLDDVNQSLAGSVERKFDLKFEKMPNNEDRYALENELLTLDTIRKSKQRLIVARLCKLVGADLVMKTEEEMERLAQHAAISHQHQAQGGRGGGGSDSESPYSIGLSPSTSENTPSAFRTTRDRSSLSVTDRKELLEQQQQQELGVFAKVYAHSNSQERKNAEEEYIYQLRYQQTNPFGKYSVHWITIGSDKYPFLPFHYRSNDNRYYRMKEHASPIITDPRSNTGQINNNNEKQNALNNFGSFASFAMNSNNHGSALTSPTSLSQQQSPSKRRHSMFSFVNSAYGPFNNAAHPPLSPTTTTTGKDNNNNNNSAGNKSNSNNKSGGGAGGGKGDTNNNTLNLTASGGIVAIAGGSTNTRAMSDAGRDSGVDDTEFGFGGGGNDPNSMVTSPVRLYANGLLQNAFKSMRTGQASSAMRPLTAITTHWKDRFGPYSFEVAQGHIFLCVCHLRTKRVTAAMAAFKEAMVAFSNLEKEQSKNKVPESLWMVRYQKYIHVLHVIAELRFVATMTGVSTAIDLMHAINHAKDLFFIHSSFLIQMCVHSCRDLIETQIRQNDPKNANNSLQSLYPLAVVAEQVVARACDVCSVESGAISAMLQSARYIVDHAEWMHRSHAAVVLHDTATTRAISILDSIVNMVKSVSDSDPGANEPQLCRYISALALALLSGSAKAKDPIVILEGAEAQIDEATKIAEAVCGRNAREYEMCLRDKILLYEKCGRRDEAAEIRAHLSELSRSPNFSVKDNIRRVQVQMAQSFRAADGEDNGLLMTDEDYYGYEEDNQDNYYSGIRQENSSEQFGGLKSNLNRSSGAVVQQYVDETLPIARTADGKLSVESKSSQLVRKASSRALAAQVNKERKMRQKQVKDFAVERERNKKEAAAREFKTQVTLLDSEERALRISLANRESKALNKLPFVFWPDLIHLDRGGISLQEALKLRIAVSLMRPFIRAKTSRDYVAWKQEWKIAKTTKLLQAVGRGYLTRSDCGLARVRAAQRRKAVAKKVEQTTRTTVSSRVLELLAARTIARCMAGYRTRLHLFIKMSAKSFGIKHLIPHNHYLSRDAIFAAMQQQQQQQHHHRGNTNNNNNTTASVSGMTPTMSEEDFSRQPRTFNKNQQQPHHQYNTPLIQLGSKQQQQQHSTDGGGGSGARGSSFHRKRTNNQQQQYHNKVYTHVKEIEIDEQQLRAAMEEEEDVRYLKLQEMFHYYLGEIAQYQQHQHQSTASASSSPRHGRRAENNNNNNNNPQSPVTMNHQHHQRQQQQHGSPVSAAFSPSLLYPRPPPPHVGGWLKDLDKTPNQALRHQVRQQQAHHHGESPTRKSAATTSNQHHQSAAAAPTTDPNSPTRGRRAPPAPHQQRY